MAYWDVEKEIAEIPASGTSKIAVIRGKKSGKEFVAIREWYCTQSDPTWKPSKNGINVHAGNVAKLLANAIQEANAQ